MKFFACVIFIVLSAIPGFGQTRSIAVTIDDLPVVSTRQDLKTRQEITTKLLRAINRERIPAIGFVNESKLYTSAIRDELQVDLLRQWLVAGLELGNHTFSHLDLHGNSLEKYEAEILRGEIITKQLLGSMGMSLTYFRHPFLHTGMDLETKTSLKHFLQVHGYRIAPVTIDNSDWIFARAYDNAFDQGDRKLMKRIGAAYVPYLQAKMDYWERQSVRLFKREMSQILLIHANFINSEYLGGIAAMLKKRGYKFITLGEALKDGAFTLPDNFVKSSGISWLHRWALDRGRNFLVPDEPKCPEFVMKAAGVNSE